jgi:hypothetical protein
MKSDPHVYKLMQKKLQSIPLPSGYAYGEELFNAVNAELRELNLAPIPCFSTLISLLSYHRTKNHIPAFLMNRGKTRTVYAYPIAAAVGLYKNIRTKRKLHSLHSTQIWAPLPQKYALNPNWMTLSTIAKVLGCPIKRLHCLTRESTDLTVFLNPSTKRKMANIEDIKAKLPWRDAKWLIRHTPPEQHEYIMRTAPKKTIKTDAPVRSFYYCPQFIGL